MDFSEILLNPHEIRLLRRHLKIPPKGHSIIDDFRPSSLPVKIVSPYDHTYVFRVKKKESGVSILELMSTRFPFRSKEDWQKRIRSGVIKVNDTTVDELKVIRVNDNISHRNIGVTEPSVPNDISVLRQGPGYLIVDKSAPIPMHAGGRYNRNTVVDILSEKGYGPLHIVHRLDAVTSGYLLLGRSPEFARQFSRVMSDGGIRKTYEAIVSGVPSEDSITIDRGIKRDRGFLFKCSDDADSKKAITKFRVIHRGDGWSQIACEPVTGRTHQIRLHLAEWGYPIWDDYVYNKTMNKNEEHTKIQNRAISLVSMGLSHKE